MNLRTRCRQVVTAIDMLMEVVEDDYGRRKTTTRTG